MELQSFRGLSVSFCIGSFYPLGPGSLLSEITGVTDLPVWVSVIVVSSCCDWTSLQEPCPETCKQGPVTKVVLHEYRQCLLSVNFPLSIN